MTTACPDSPLREPRVAFRRPVHLSVLLPKSRLTYRVRSNDLSRGGMGLACKGPWDEGTPVELSLEARGKLLPFARARVAWSTPRDTPAMGVRFEKFLHPRAAEMVNVFVERLEPASFAWPDARGLGPMLPLGRIVWGAFALTVVLSVAALVAVWRTDWSSAPPRPRDADPTVAGVQLRPPVRVEPARVTTPANEVGPRVWRIGSGGLESVGAQTEGESLAVQLYLARGAQLSQAVLSRKARRISLELQGQMPNRTVRLSLPPDSPFESARVLKTRRGALVQLLLRRGVSLPLERGGAVSLGVHARDAARSGVTPQLTLGNR